MSDGKYVKHDRGYVDEYEVYEQDLSEWGPLAIVCFNVDWVPSANREWFLEVLSKEFSRIAERSYQEGVHKVRRDVRKALGL